MKKYITLFFVLLFFANCKKSVIPNDIILPIVVNTPQTYLALGDSYTIGQSVTAAESFPFQLANQLKLNGIKYIIGPEIVARTGWTTSDLQAGIKTAIVNEDISRTKYDIVTLLIGVNNQFRKQSQTVYRKEFKELLQTAITFAGGNKNKVFVISIPDWGATPFGGKNRNLITRKEIDEFNAINKTETLALRISYTDITEASRNAATDLELVAKDDLHPSGKMYLDWAVNVSKAVLKSYR